MSGEASLPAEVVQELSRPSNGRGLFDLASSWGLIALAWWIAERWRTPIGLISAFFLIANRQSALANLAHDAYHGLCFRSRRLNHAVGSWLYSFPVGIPFEHDRLRHLSHHRLVGHPSDPDWTNYSNHRRESPRLVVMHFLARLCGSLLVVTLISLLKDGKMPIPASEKEASHRPVEILWLALTQAVLALGLTLRFHWWTYPVLWLLPLITVASAVNHFRSYVEHSARSDHDSHPSERLTDFAASWVERVCISPCHFNLHALHHLFPSIPHYRLPETRRRLSQEGGGYPLRVQASYWHAFMGHLRRLEDSAAD